MPPSDCLSWRVENCNEPTCRWYEPPVAGDLLRRRPMCGLAAIDVAALSGGLSQSDVAWLLGLTQPGVGAVERRALRRVERRLRRLGVDSGAEEREGWTYPAGGDQ